jgi:hypothetical protein
LSRATSAHRFATTAGLSTDDEEIGLAWIDRLPSEPAESASALPFPAVNRQSSAPGRKSENAIHVVKEHDPTGKQKAPVGEPTGALYLTRRFAVSAFR